MRRFMVATIAMLIAGFGSVPLAMAMAPAVSAKGQAVAAGAVTLALESVDDGAIDGNDVIVVTRVLVKVVGDSPVPADALPKLSLTAGARGMLYPEVSHSGTTDAAFQPNSEAVCIWTFKVPRVAYNRNTWMIRIGEKGSLMRLQ
jgi:hypothetical protein